MKMWKYWHVWAPKVIAVLLMLTPFVFGLTMVGSHAWNAWLVGAVVGVVGVSLAMFWWIVPRHKIAELLTVMVGTALCVSPWALDEIHQPIIFAVSTLLGVLLIVTVAGIWIENGGRPLWLDHKVPTNSLEAKMLYSRDEREASQKVA